MLTILMLLWQTSMLSTFEVTEGVDSGTLVGSIQDIKEQDTEMICFMLDKNVESKLFDVDRKSGKIYTTTWIERESLIKCRGQVDCFVSLKIACSTDNDVGISEVTINIVDVNNNPPTFYPNYMVVEFDENDPPEKEIELPPPYDYDSPKNGISDCFLNEKEDWVSLRVIKGDIWALNLSLNRGLMKSEQMITVACVDGGRNQLSGRMTVKLVKKSRDKCIKPKFDYKTLTIVVSPTTTSDWMYVTTLKAFPTSNSVKIQQNHFSLLKPRDTLMVDPLNGSIFIKESLIDNDKPIEVTATVCCEELCDTCLLVIQANVHLRGNELKVSLASARNDGLFVMEKSVLGDKTLAYVVVESPLQGAAVCESNRSDIADIKRLSPRSFVVVGRKLYRRNNGTECVEIVCKITDFVGKPKSMCIQIEQQDIVLTKKSPEYVPQKRIMGHLSNKLSFVVTTAILSLMMLLLSTFVMVRCYRLQKSAKREYKDVLDPTSGQNNPILLHSLTPVRYIEEITTQSGRYLMDESRGYNFNESNV